MAYTYKYIPAGQAIHKSPKETYRDDLQANLDEYFYSASDWYSIQEESSFASGTYQDVDVRINRVVDLQTGERIGDDFKKLLFKEIDHSVDLGRYYQFSNNYWIAINVEKLNSVTQTATVRRCNYILKWSDSNGAIYQVPCSIGYLIKENRDYSTAGSNVVVPSGMDDIIVQRNSITNKIKPNQRFLFGVPGNFISYRVEGGGIANFNNTETANSSSAGYIRFSVVVDFGNYEGDDLVNGIANTLDEVYVLTLNESSLTGNATQTVQLRSTVTLNGAVVSRNVTWSSNHSDIASVSSSGLVTFVSTGSAVITCSLENNSSVSDTCSVVVGTIPVDHYQIVFSPTTNYVLEGNTQIYSVYLYKNNVQQADSMTFSLDSNSVPSSNYTYQVLDGHRFSIKNNNMYLTDTLDITATSGIYSGEIKLTMRGAW